MKSSVHRTFGPVEVRPSDHPHTPHEHAVSGTDRLPDRANAMAKSAIGAAIGAAIGEEAYKAYGDPGFMTKVVSGEKVPDYLARIYQEPAARRRLAFKLLEGTGVTVKTVVEWEEKVG